MNIIEMDDHLKLFLVRLLVEQPVKNKIQLLHHAESYVGKKDKKAFLAMVREEPVGCVECKLYEDVPRGFTSFENQSTLGHIAHIDVLEQFRRNGIATSLLEKAELWFSEKGKTGVWLDYISNNGNAERLYRRSGYITVASAPDEVKKVQRNIALKTW